MIQSSSSFSKLIFSLLARVKGARQKTLKSGSLIYSVLFAFLIYCFPFRGLAQDLPFEVPSDPLDLPTSALIETTKGPIEIEFFREEAPVTVANFAWLAKKGFYDKIFFHYYRDGFIVQGGDPSGTGKGGPGYTIPAEFSKIRHVPGIVGMAKRPNPVNPERRSNGSQFYITLNRAKHLDGLYSVFAKVINGLENAYRLRRGDRIVSVRFPRKNSQRESAAREQEPVWRKP